MIQDDVSLMTLDDGTEIMHMNRLYNKYGACAAEAKYVKLEGTPRIVMHTFRKVVRV